MQSLTASLIGWEAWHESMGISSGKPSCQLQATGSIQLSSASIRKTVSQQFLVGLLLAVGLSGAIPYLGNSMTQHCIQGNVLFKDCFS